jgi:hypothetical protein
VYMPVWGVVAPESPIDLVTWYFGAGFRAGA